MHYLPRSYLFLVMMAFSYTGETSSGHVWTPYVDTLDLHQFPAQGRFWTGYGLEAIFSLQWDCLVLEPLSSLSSGLRLWWRRSWRLSLVRSVSTGLPHALSIRLLISVFNDHRILHHGLHAMTLLKHYVETECAGSWVLPNSAKKCIYRQCAIGLQDNRNSALWVLIPIT